MILKYLETEPNPRRVVWFRRLVALFCLILLFVTYRLWIPQTHFPQIPLFEIATSIPKWIDWAFCATLLVGLAGVVFSNEKFAVGQVGCLLAVVSLAGLFVLDQHRLQPWAYLSFIGLLPMAFCQGKRTLAIWRLLMISVYLFSASNKFDFTFLNRMGYRFLESALNIVGFEIGNVPGTVRELMVFSFPLCELLVGILLFFKTTRIAGVYLATLFHIGLMLVLSPLGLGHKSGVLIWNLAFVVQIWFLFYYRNVRTNQTANEDSELKNSLLPPGAASFAQTIASWISIGIAFFPALEPFGYCDHWPAWSLYSERLSKVEINIQRRHIPALPVQARPFVASSGANDQWVKLYYEQWSLQSLNAPVYPQERFHIGVAHYLSTTLTDPNAIRVIIYGIPDRKSGSRTKEWIVGQQEIEKRIQEYRLNGMPRL